MRAIKLNLYQQTANYRIPNSYNIRQTYPLPAYSTVIGMIHSACDFSEYHDMLLGIQGNHASEHVTLNTGYFFGTGKYEEDRHNMKIKTKNGDIGMSRGLMNTHVLSDVHLTIYIVPDENDFNIIVDRFKKPNKFLSLGRHEDAIRIDNVEVVELDEIEDDSEFGFDGFSFVPVDLIDEEIKGTIYNLNKKFFYDKKNIRQWESSVPAIYTSKPFFLKKSFEDKKNETLVVLA